MVIVDKIKAWLLSSFLTNIARRLLSYTGGALVASEILTGAEAETWETLTLKVVAGAIVILGDLAWSYFEKKTLKATMPMK